MSQSGGMNLNLIAASLYWNLPFTQRVIVLHKIFVHFLLNNLYISNLFNTNDGYYNIFEL